jgi:hypothetical protein
MGLEDGLEKWGGKVRILVLYYQNSEFRVLFLR